MTKYSVKWSAVAEDELNMIIDYIAVDNNRAALNILMKIKKITSQLNISPELGRVVPELMEYGCVKYRELICDYWRILYSVEQDTVYIRCVVDARRDLEDMLTERFL